MKTALTLAASLVALVVPHAFAEDEEDGRTFGTGSLPLFLTPFDVNEDGVLSEEERQAARAARKENRESRRARIDTDGDGIISDAEKEAARAAARAKILEHRNARFNGADTNGDGVISPEEFRAIPAIDNLIENYPVRGPIRARIIFSRLDSDDNGEISLEEFLQHFSDHRDRGALPDRVISSGQR